jgi:short-subunit dehydrogenase
MVYMLAKQKKVLITGATSGFGTYLAKAFAHAGYAIVLHGRDEGKLRVVESEILSKERVRCTTVLADLLNADGLNAIISAMSTLDIDVLVNNAAINPETHRRGTPSNIGDINAVLSTNTAAAIALCFGAFEHFVPKGEGYIININSSSALIGSYHEPVYAASKFGLRGFSESVKALWLKQGIKITDVYPDALATGFASNRPNFDVLTDPRELADLIVGICATKSFFVRELGVQRTRGIN